MKVVLDTNCLIVCLTPTSPFYCVWQAFRNKQITLCFTTDILNEYNEVLLRFYPREHAESVINELLLSPNIVKTTNYFKWNLISADPDDNKFVDCALNAGAELIVSNDKHFNVLKEIDFPVIQVVDMTSLKKIVLSKS